MAKLVELIYTEICRGKGTEEDPCRTVKQWFEKDGTLVVEDDPKNEYMSKYHDLIFAVGNKFPEETRHQTALRYIMESERRNDNTAKQEAGSNG